MGNAVKEFNQDFESGVLCRVASAVKADPALQSRYDGIWWARFVELALKSFFGVLIIPIVWGGWSVTTVHGPLNDVILLSANIAGTLVPLCVVGGLWKLLTGPDVTAAIPRLPVTDERNFAAAWRQYSRWIWRSVFVFWLLIYAELVWYGGIWSESWAWVPVFAAIMACFSMALCGVVSLVNYLLKDQAPQAHLLWLLTAFGAFWWRRGKERYHRGTPRWWIRRIFFCRPIWRPRRWSTRNRGLFLRWPRWSG